MTATVHPIRPDRYTAVLDLLPPVVRAWATGPSWEAECMVPPPEVIRASSIPTEEIAAAIVRWHEAALAAAMGE